MNARSPPLLCQYPFELRLVPADCQTRTRTHVTPQPPPFPQVRRMNEALLSPQEALKDEAAELRARLAEAAHVSPPRTLGRGTLAALGPCPTARCCRPDAHHHLITTIACRRLRPRRRRCLSCGVSWGSVTRSWQTRMRRRDPAACSQGQAGQVAALPAQALCRARGPRLELTITPESTILCLSKHRRSSWPSAARSCGRWGGWEGGGRGAGAPALRPFAGGSDSPPPLVAPQSLGPLPFSFLCHYVQALEAKEAAEAAGEGRAAQAEGMARQLQQLRAAMEEREVRRQRGRGNPLFCSCAWIELAHA